MNPSPGALLGARYLALTPETPMSKILSAIRSTFDRHLYRAALIVLPSSLLIATQPDPFFNHWRVNFACLQALATVTLAAILRDRAAVKGGRQ